MSYAAEYAIEKSKEPGLWGADQAEYRCLVQWYLDRDESLSSARDHARFRLAEVGRCV